MVCDTTKRTIKIYKGMEPFSIPGDVESRLMAALDKKMAARKQVAALVAAKFWGQPAILMTLQKNEFLPSAPR